jgi:catechol 2,3-dioxygenase-like lactoylglutathione lyase family enzyme
MFCRSGTGLRRSPFMDLKLEVVILPVSDVERAKQFYVSGLGCREDIDVQAGDFRAVQLTPPGSACSIIFGTAVSSSPPGSLDRLLLVVDDIDKARNELIGRGVDVGEIFHDAAGGPGAGFAPPEARAPGLDPGRQSYASYAIFRDPDGNTFMLQEVTERAPGRV